MLDVRRCLDHLVRNYKFVQSDPADVARHDRMVSLVEQMLALHKQLPESLAHTTKRPPCKRPDRGHGRADRCPGLRALRSDGGGDRDCGGGEQVNILNAVDFLTDVIYLFQADEEKFR